MTDTTRSEERWEATMAGEHKYIKEEEDDDAEEEEDDDGPPPGFHCITSQTETKKVTAAEERNPDEQQEQEDEERELEDEEDDGDIDGPPPGWSSIPPTLQPVHTCDIGVDQGQLICSRHSDIEMSDNQEVLEEDEDGPPPGWDFGLQTLQVEEAVPTDTDTGKLQEAARSSDEGAQPGRKFVPPSMLLPPASLPPPPAPSLPLEKGQMVCGSCRQLLAYPRGVKHVQCGCCQTVNLVLEAHQVGQVKCGVVQCCLCIQGELLLSDVALAALSQKLELTIGGRLSLLNKLVNCPL